MQNSEKKPKSILHIDMDAFFVSVETVINPKLKGKQVIVGGPIEGRGVVTSASYQAREKGVHSAMPMVAAKKLCPNAIFLTGSHHLYSDFSRRIMEIMERYTPAVEQVSIDEAYLDITGCLRLHRTKYPFVIANSIHETIANEIGVPCSIGIATNRVTAKIAANLAKPNGVLEVYPDCESAFLSPLPVRKLPGVGPVAEKEYKKLGIREIGDLLKFDPAVLTRVLGKQAEQCAKRAGGESSKDQAESNFLSQERDTAKSIGKEITYSVDTGDPEILAATLAYLSERVAGRMRKAGLSFRKVTLKLRYADFDTYTRSKTINLPTSDPSVIYRTARALLTSLDKKRQKIRLIGVTVSTLTKPDPQINLFDQAENEDKKRKLLNSIDETRERYGFTSIMSARWLGHSQLR